MVEKEKKEASDEGHEEPASPVLQSKSHRWTVQ